MSETSFKSQEFPGLSYALKKCPKYTPSLDILRPFISHQPSKLPWQGHLPPGENLPLPVLSWRVPPIPAEFPNINLANAALFDY